MQTASRSCNPGIFPCYLPSHPKDSYLPPSLSLVLLPVYTSSDCNGSSGPQHRELPDPNRILGRSERLNGGPGHHVTADEYFPHRALVGPAQQRRKCCAALETIKGTCTRDLAEF